MYSLAGNAAAARLGVPALRHPRHYSSTCSLFFLLDRVSTRYNVKCLSRKSKTQQEDDGRFYLI
jgi:hypothetical protein